MGERRVLVGRIAFRWARLRAIVHVAVISGISSKSDTVQTGYWGENRAITIETHGDQSAKCMNLETL